MLHKACTSSAQFVWIEANRGVDAQRAGVLTHRAEGLTLEPIGTLFVSQPSLAMGIVTEKGTCFNVGDAIHKVCEYPWYEIALYFNL